VEALVDHPLSTNSEPDPIRESIIETDTYRR
jgi:hypothetical protein